MDGVEPDEIALVTSEHKGDPFAQRSDGTVRVEARLEADRKLSS
jgi:hypothetical protein